MAEYVNENVTIEHWNVFINPDFRTKDEDNTYILLSNPPPAIVTLSHSSGYYEPLYPECPNTA